jgi:hypothetical protein
MKAGQNRSVLTTLKVLRYAKLSETSSDRECQVSGIAQTAS